MANPSKPQAPTGKPKPGAPGGLPGMTAPKPTPPGQKGPQRPTPHPGTVTPMPTHLPTWADALSGDKRDAYIAVYKLFQSYGLATLAPKIFEYVQKGYSADTISMLLQDTAEYKKRFAGNELRRQAGMPVLSASDYLSLESQYRQELREGGM